MPRFEIKIAGLGGQGIVLAGIVIGTAASIFGRKNATQSQSYGPEARGGSCKSEIVISDEEIDYPKTVKPDVLALMSQEAYNKYSSNLKKGGVIIYDPDMVQDVNPRKDVKLYPVPATRMAEEIGRKIVANMVIVGAIVALVQDLEIEWIENAVEKNVPKGTEDLNIGAVRSGYHYTKNLLEGGK